MERKGHLILGTEPGSIAEEMGIEPGDRLLEINGETVEDVFDYRYMIEEEYIEVLILKPSGEEWLLEIEKEYEEDLGITFENGLMDEYRSCRNKCIFCFIDQMPPGMRETLYFKDDDSRLSFLQGNYITLTNMKEKDIDRIIKFHLSPINISVHTTNPELRCQMLNNRFAGKALAMMDKLFAAGTPMNGQIVLCRGINDGPELEKTISDLSRYLPAMESVSVVPVGLTKYREGLYPLEAFTKEDACRTIDLIEAWQKKLYREHGTHFIHASDEFYLLAERELPEAERYDGYLQLENGVGMLRLLGDEVREALEACEDDGVCETLSIATGLLPFPYLKQYICQITRRFPGREVYLYPITNDFFGSQITVAGLLTGQDLASQLKGKPLGSRLLLSSALFRSGEEVFLDDWTKADLEKALQVPIRIVKSSGQDLVNAVLGFEEEEEFSSKPGYELSE